MRLVSAFLVIPMILDCQTSSNAGKEYSRRVEAVRHTPGFVALWDFVRREDGSHGKGRFNAYQRSGEKADLRLDVANYVKDYWGEGPSASYADFRLLGRGPFGQAVHFAKQPNNTFRPLFLIPRARIHNSALDAKGPNRSVSLVAWIVRETGNHMIAGIWHEGTDLKIEGAEAKRVERGKRQYALFMGLAAKNGASAAHVSENGAASFGDRFARNLSSTPDVIPPTASNATPEVIDQGWSVAAFSFDNQRNTVTSYLNGVAKDFWIDNPEKHSFFQWPAKGWREGSYTPPEGKPLKVQILSKSNEERVELRTYEFTKVKLTFVKDESGRLRKLALRQLVALRANPFWFGHDLYNPIKPEDGGPFTIGEAIHTSRTQGFTGYFGALAVFDRALSPKDMTKLAAIGRGASAPLNFADLP